MFHLIRKLKSLGVLGMNARNADFVQRYNPRSHYPLVDDKLKTKQLAIENFVAVPELYHVVEIQRDIAHLSSILDKHHDFVVKPAHGSGGDGIVVIVGKRKTGFVKASGEMISQESLYHHISNILTGMYSLGGQPDKAVIEYRVLFDPVFEEISYQGVPDIRMIVFQGYPVMGMLRLPTRTSQGKANLHQGAVGVGLDLATGKTTFGTWMNQVIDYHPDTGHDIAGLTIPYWEKLLTISASCFEMAGLGYLGVDMVLDKQKGPLMLELNARPGLSIQIANQAGLQPRLNRIQTLSDNDNRLPSERVAFSQTYFGQH